jgi:hypothetical protein
MSNKVKPHNKVATVLLSGKMISIEDIKTSFSADKKMSSLMYRLSTYIYDIRKYENGVVKVQKDGRKVTGYQLVNFDEFDTEGRYVGSQKSVKPAVPTEQKAESVQENAQVTT